jgi:hypothetical protein
MITATVKPKAFLIFANDVDPAHRNAYESWHAQHHVPQRLTVTGILSATRYRGPSAGSREYLTLYELADLAVLSGPAYRQLVDYPDAVTLAMRPHLRRSERLACQLLTAEGIPQDGPVMVVSSLTPPLALLEACAAERDSSGCTWNLLGQTDPGAGGHPLTQRIPVEAGTVLVLGYPQTADLADRGFHGLRGMVSAVRVAGPYIKIDQ